MLIKEHIGEYANSSGQVADILHTILFLEDEIDRDKEHFWVIGLDAKNKIRFIDLVSLGILTTSLIHPREVFRLAVHQGVVSIIVGHNHPSGDPTPSREDISITERLKNAGVVLGIGLFDHIIVANNGGFVSMKEKGVL